ncbi:CGNR zinc finger domain-containing protein [Brevibacillus brevis]|uniref:CGNR zinc finger domain-containing protein n=1 Tax=Brevibacillus brevis TaxID=1393 RepID=A0ABY9T8A1_BREBE|nr:CGNR zinc finger domain-containing protein [Brevibacillus brevis]WNC15147.1 CGNR zinc finger domain-containing protein [Brevibacillus brevis]
MTTLQRRLISLREICRSVLLDLEEAKTISADSCERLRSFIQAIPLYTDIELESDKLAERYRGATQTDDILYQIAISVVHTLQTVQAERIRKCEHEDCVLYFADTSKAGKRRWCSMELCGNRQKAATFYKRKNLNPE